VSEDYYNYKTLRQLQQKEQKTPTPTQIPNDFYIKVESFVKALEENFDENANVLKAKLYKQELANTKKLAQSIYDLREKKIVSAALIAARNAQPDLSYFIDVELELYQKLLEALKESRQSLSKEIPKEKKHDSKNESRQPAIQHEHKEKKEEQQKKIFSKQAHTSEPTRVVRVIEDLPEFVGTDTKTYSLHQEDVLCLPESMVPLLCKRGIIQEVFVKNSGGI